MRSKIGLDGLMAIQEILVWFCCMILVPASIAWGFSGGPPNGMTGAPGEGTCHDCHNSFGLNLGNGVLRIFGPEEFEAGQSYEIMIDLQQFGPSRWGFEFSPLEVGSCSTWFMDTQVDVEEGKTYVKQTSQGTFDGYSSAVWAFTWTAPVDPPDTVIFYAAGNAANSDGASSGDYIYTTSFTSTLMQVDADNDPELPSTMMMLSSGPNPLKNNAMISFSLPASTDAQLELYDVEGTHITTLFSGLPYPGQNKVLWDGRDLNNRSVPNGVYFCRLSARDVNVTRPLVVLR